MGNFKKFRVKTIVVDDYDNTIKYKIQKFIPILGWVGYCDAVKDMNWAHNTCLKLNTPYDEGESIVLRIDTISESEWLINAALKGIETVHAKGTPVHDDMLKLQQNLQNQINKQK